MLWLGVKSNMKISRNDSVDLCRWGQCRAVSKRDVCRSEWARKKKQWVGHKHRLLYPGVQQCHIQSPLQGSQTWHGSCCHKTVLAKPLRCVPSHRWCELSLWEWEQNRIRRKTGRKLLYSKVYIFIPLNSLYHQSTTTKSHEFKKTFISICTL